MKKNSSAKSMSLLFSFLGELFNFSRVKVTLSFVLQIFNAVTQGVGILLLLTFLQVIGLETGAAPANRYGQILGNFLKSMGLPLNLISVLGAYIFLISLFAFIELQNTLIISKIRNGFTRSLRINLFKTILDVSWQNFVNMKSAHINHVITMSIQRIAAATHFLVTISSLSVVSIIQIFIAFLISPVLTLITVAFGLLFIFFLKGYSKISLLTGERTSSANRAMFDSVANQLASLKETKSFNAERRNLKIFEKTCLDIESGSTNFNKANALTKMFFLISIVIGVSIIVYTSVAVLNLPTIEILVIVFIMARLLPGFGAILQSYQRLRNALPYFLQVKELSEALKQSKEIVEISDKKLIKLSESIKLQDISFRYPSSNGIYTLKDVSFELQAKKITAIYGPSGSGKSTLADILLGLLLQEKGEIRIDWKLLDSKTIHQWRSSVGYVPQESFLFHDTINNNLLWAKPDATDEQLKQALEQSSALEFVSRLPQGQETVVGDRGMMLSGGERRRIALARAILRQPTMLILDEATSSLDNKNEQHILRAISQLRGVSTVLIIAHKASILSIADHIIEIDDGSVSWQGSYESYQKNSRH